MMLKFFMIIIALDAHDEYKDHQMVEYKTIQECKAQLPERGFMRLKNGSTILYRCVIQTGA